MRVLVFVIFFILGLGQAIACTSFAGTYTCTETGGSEPPYQMSVVQNGNAFSITDDDGTEEIIADNQWHNREDEEDIVDASYISFCLNQSIIVNLKGNYLQGGQKIPVVVNMNHQKQANGNIHSTTLIILLGSVHTTETICEVHASFSRF